MSAETFEPTTLQWQLFLELHPEALELGERPPADSVWYALVAHKPRLVGVANIARAGLGDPQSSPHAKAQLAQAMKIMHPSVRHLINNSRCLNNLLGNALLDDAAYTDNLNQLAGVADGL